MPISASAGTRASVARRFLHRRRGSPTRMARNLLIGQRLGIGIVRHRQPHQRQHEGLRAFEAVAMQAAGQVLQRDEEFTGAGRIGRRRIAGRGGLQRRQGAVARPRSSPRTGRLPLRALPRTAVDNGASRMKADASRLANRVIFSPARRAGDHTRIWCARLSVAMQGGQCGSTA